MKLKITEIFKSIQGESSYAGLPCVFVRLSGCNLNCNWCDTPYARIKGKYYTIDKIMSYIVNLKSPLVEITE